MIALDTNVLVRFLVDDDPAQCRRARVLVKRAADRKGVYISDIVLCETVWVLSRAYRLQRKDICRVLRQLLMAREVTLASPDAAAGALDAYEKKKGDFADYLILEHAQAAGCRTVVTFDRALLEEHGFTAP